jgi:2-polyprenyl-6-hydroxyphenyl methylase/3-demethylubiquinone-9 3-methyltransferase
MLAAQSRVMPSSGSQPCQTIDELKASASTRLKFQLANATVYESELGYTFLRYLDPETPQAPQVLSPAETAKLHDYLRTQLQSNDEKFRKQLAILKNHMPDRGASVLDIGCGGGAFLEHARRAGYRTAGIEREPNRAAYCRTVCGCTIHENDVTDPDFRNRHRASWDAVSLWDVIEHVNYPYETLAAVFDILKPGGILLIDTPAKDGFYHRFGELTYKLTNGRYPTFLNLMYAERPFGHKQIFSTGEIRELAHSIGFEIERIGKFHELSFPYEFYLKKLLRSKFLARQLAPLAGLFFSLFKVHNKMLLVARKPEEQPGGEITGGPLSDTPGQPNADDHHLENVG